MEPAAGHTGGPIMQAMDELSGEDLVDRSGATAQQLRRLVDLGIITPTPQGRYRRSDIQRIRVVDALADAGFAPEQLSDLIAKGAYSLDWASVAFPEPTAQLTTTLEQTAAAAGLPEGFAGRLFDAWELPRPQPGQALRADDDELLRLAAGALAGWGATRPPCWGRPGSLVTACEGWPSPRCGCSTPTSRSGWPPRDTRSIPGPTTSTSSPRT
jgi:DNA-binding transcriptional MerR regulator